MLVKSINDLWAKSSPDKSVAGESIVSHTYNVIQAFLSYIKLNPDLPKTLDFHDLWHLAFWSCILHDLGKSAEGFQKQLRIKSEKWGKRHEILSLAFVELFFKTTEKKQLVSSAIVSHHKDFDFIYEKFDNLLIEENPEDDIIPEMIGEIDKTSLKLILEWLSNEPNKYIKELELTNFGIKPLNIKEESINLFYEKASERIWDNLKSYYGFYNALKKKDYSDKSVKIAFILRAILIMSDHLASAGEKLVNLPDLSMETKIFCNKYFKAIDYEKLHEHQKIVNITEDSTILISPTGSGKTESALLWLNKQLKNINSQPRIYYILPYQASLNAMKLRFNNYFGNISSLQHGKAFYFLYKSLLDSDENLDRISAEKMTKRYKNLAKLNAYPVRIMTPYQLLKAFYRLKGYESILYECMNGLFVFDELHAYDSDRLGLFLGAMKYLKEVFNAKFFVMSATMPKILTDELYKIDNFKLVRATEETFSKFKRHKVNIIEFAITSTESLALIKNLSAIEGKSVLVCCNTVKTAQEIYRNLKADFDEETEIKLLHSRFNTADRNSTEKYIMEHMKTGNEGSKKTILVATQVVEVSLNIDFDTIITEPAPMDALIQRFGRVNRGLRHNFSDVFICLKYDEKQKIYEKSLLDNTLRVLKDNNHKIIEENQVENWLNNIYDENYISFWQKSLNNKKEMFFKSQINNLIPFNSNDNRFENDFNKLFDGIEVLPLNLFEKYMEFKNDDKWLDANELTLNISYRQFFQIKSKYIVSDRDRDIPPVVGTNYSKEFGLEI